MIRFKPQTNTEGGISGDSGIAGNADLVLRAVELQGLSAFPGRPGGISGKITDMTVSGPVHSEGSIPLVERHVKNQIATFMIGLTEFN